MPAVQMPNAAAKYYAHVGEASAPEEAKKIVATIDGIGPLMHTARAEAPATRAGSQ